MIPLSTPNLSGNEWNYIKDCLDTNWVSSAGSYVNKFEEVVADYTGVKYAIATSNGTAALHISLMLAGVGQGDLVIAPNLTFVATINSIKYLGADPILIDADPHTWQMDLDLLENYLGGLPFNSEGYRYVKDINRVIKAIVPVHVLGNMCDMDRLLEICQKYRIVIVEDSAEALGSFYKKKHAGSFGLFGTLSFNGNKLITTGGGGMILTNDSNLGKRAKHITTTAKSDPHEYYHDEVGYNYRLVNILAAMGVAQMEQLETFLKRKVEIRDYYNARLSIIESFADQQILASVQPNNWLYTVKLPRAKELLSYLAEQKIEARPFWIPMNRLPACALDSYISHSNHSEHIYQSCVSLPCSTSLTDNDLESVVNRVERYYSF